MSRILLIEDDISFRTMLCVALRQMGHEVIEASEGSHGVGLYQTGNFDLVITDLIMPGQEGIETITQLIKAYPSVKIIAMSGGGRTTPDSYLKMAKRLGAKEALTKPFSMQELNGAVDRVLAMA
ncbi:MAG: response regulator [Rariglobus sp.]|jgi:DNA-binding NtrC family response regulator|nr:response regulator [Rariglobus sp.]